MGTPKAINDSRAMMHNENNKGTVLEAQAPRESTRFIYLYNILRGWDFQPVRQPPTFPNFKIPRCEPNERFAWTVLPEMVNEIYAKPGGGIGDQNSILYITRPGTEAANSLMNPDAHPSNPFEAQFRDISKFGNMDMQGKNLNAFGVWWSWTEPDDPALEEEIAEMQKRVDGTMRGLIKKANRLDREIVKPGQEGGPGAITALMHFAMDYFHLQSKWHESNEHRIPCPNCGEPVRMGIAYHKNEFGDRCIIDRERYEAAIELTRPKRQDIPPAPPVTEPVGETQAT